MSLRNAPSIVAVAKSVVACSLRPMTRLPANTKIAIECGQSVIPDPRTVDRGGQIANSQVAKRCFDPAFVLVPTIWTAPVASP